METEKFNPGDTVYLRPEAGDLRLYNRIDPGVSYHDALGAGPFQVVVTMPSEHADGQVLKVSRPGDRHFATGWIPARVFASIEQLAAPTEASTPA